VFDNAPSDHYHYTDSFEAEDATGASRSPEQWARAVFEGAPRPVRWFLVAGFRFGLGLRFGPQGSPEHVLGWAIVERGSDSVTLQAQSWLLTSRLVFQTDGSRVKQSTHVRYDRPITAVIWPPVSIIHRQIVPRLLQHAATHATDTGESRHQGDAGSRYAAPDAQTYSDS
jgi:hypothetical protein